MNTELVQHLRFKLQKRVRRLNAISNAERYRNVLKQFWNYLQAEDLFWDVLEDLRLREAEAEAVAKAIIETEAELEEPTEMRHVATALFLIEHCITNDEERIIWNVASNLQAQPLLRKMAQALNRFHEDLVEPLYEYIDEQLDDQRALLHLLRRYKHKCEWFKQEELHALWEGDTKRGEKRLAYNLYEYLHDQGINFTIEPTSASGEVDLITDQTGEDRLIADAKVYHSDKGKHYLAKGIRQLYDYSQDFNEPFGYLIVYKTSRDGINFALSGQAQNIPYLRHNNKTLFVITIDIFPYEKSASARGKVKAVDITGDYLIDVIDVGSKQ